MKRSSSVFIVGAGASREVGIPTGDGLKQHIATRCNLLYRNGAFTGDDKIALMLVRAAGGTNYAAIDLHLQAGRHIAAALPLAISIDNFLDSHGDEYTTIVAKLAIVRSILQEERKSALFFDTSNVRNRIRFDLLGETWLNSLMQLLTQNCKREQLAERLSSLTFIVFNYDRCFEHFLFHVFVTPKIVKDALESCGLDCNAADSLALARLQHVLRIHEIFPRAYALKRFRFSVLLAHVRYALRLLGPPRGKCLGWGLPMSPTSRAALLGVLRLGDSPCHQGIVI